MKQLSVATCTLAMGLGLLVAVAQGQVVIQPALPLLTFQEPTVITHANDATNRLFVAEQRGVIYRVVNDPQTTQASQYLDIRGRVTQSGGEEGLLGLAFHPQYANNGYLYVDYIAANGTHRSVVSRFKAKAGDPDNADPNSEQILLQIPQPAYPNHKAGAIAFGADGYLYIAVGDGGSQGDPSGNGQNRATLLAKILRIDVDTAAPPLAYSIPVTNPYRGNSQGWREEIFAYGFRNPWRISFDRANGALWAADVGGSRREEIDVVARGDNFGWNTAEGSLCFQPNEGCDFSGIELPVWEYDHGVGSCIIGGYVYRGSRILQLVGQYVYADFETGTMWAMYVDGQGGTVNNWLADTGIQFSTFGEDAAGELYLAAYTTGQIYHLASTGGIGTPPAPSLSRLLRVEQNAPNPFNPGTSITFELRASAPIAVDIYDARGNAVRELQHGVLAAGAHTVHWDGRTGQGEPCSSGVYFYRVAIEGERAEARSMVLVR